MKIGLGYAYQIRISSSNQVAVSVSEGDFEIDKKWQGWYNPNLTNSYVIPD